MAPSPLLFLHALCVTHQSGATVHAKLVLVRRIPFRLSPEPLRRISPETRSIGEVRRACSSTSGLSACLDSGLSSPILSSTNMDVASLSTHMLALQRRMCSALEDIDGTAQFGCDDWSRADGSTGVTRVLQDGAVFEKAGVNVSYVRGKLSPTRAEAMRTRGRSACDAGARYEATALSFVLHAQSPYLPTLRGDVRVFATEHAAWGGGGCDLTPFYIDDKQIAKFHRHWRAVLNGFDQAYYPKFKQMCDDYFFIPARNEWRGVGGIFFDDLELPPPELNALLLAVGDEFLPSYRHILDENQELPWEPEQKRFQRVRRGRYLGMNRCAHP